ncbi:MAG: hypothetical protein K0R50_511 [Eubacterium sp.]|nr:hypothetical protein [Eubacterium sp.]
MMGHTLSRVLKKNFSTMFKRRVICLLTVLILVLPLNSVLAKDESYLKAKDILFVYDDELSAKATENIAAMADILTCMGYGTNYRTVSESNGLLDKFDSILFYHESESINLSFLEELKKLNNKIMVVGGGEVVELLKAVKVSYNTFSLEDTTIRFSYPFYNGRQTASGFINADRVTILQGKSQYSIGEIAAGGKTAALCASSGRFTGIAVFDSENDILKAVFSEQISKWKWPYENLPNSYPQHIIFDNVYPFFNTQKMLKVIELLDQKGIPYSITVIPVYQNSDYPAMKHFCEVLRYAQSKGAAIILKAPQINTSKPVLEDINQRISTAVTAYIKYGVYPIAIEVPDNWINETLGQNILKRFSTVVLYNDRQKSSWTDQEGYNTIYLDGHHFITTALFSGNLSSNMINAYPTAIFLDMNTDFATLDKQIKMVQESEVSLKSLRSASHSVYTDDKVISFRNNMLTVNGKLQSMEFAPFTYDVNYDYNRGVIGRLAENIARGNQRLLIVVTAISILFIIFIAVARHQNRKRFLYKSDSARETERRDSD